MSYRIRQRLPQFTQALRRRVSNSTRTRPGRSTLDIPRLISPLRYDVLVRAQFFRFLERHQERGIDEILRRAKDEPYFVWFEHVECARFFPELLTDRDLLSERYNARVRGALATLTSFRDTGIDARFPVVLVKVPDDTIADSGAPALGTLHIADGCHRLALLLMDGQSLEPWMHQVRPATRPLQDNTALLVPKLAIGDAEYADFLIPAFLPCTEGARLGSGITKSHENPSALRAEIAERNPDLLATFDRVVAAQRR
jgi:hypothetical protein